MELVKTLRGENGCPWDRKQTPETIGVYLIEEVYELMEAIASGNVSDIREELGDVFFQIVFFMCLYEENRDFTHDDVIDAISEKMVRRHPHVFADMKTDSVDVVKKRWQEIKKEEKKEKNGDLPASVLDSIPKSLPALPRAYRVSSRAAGLGFDWDDIKGVMDKVEEEWAEFKKEVARYESSKDKDIQRKKISVEFGDILFTMVNVARFAKIHPETALNDATSKFEKRFRFMENAFEKNGRSIEDVQRDELENMWGTAKASLEDKL